MPDASNLISHDPSHQHEPASSSASASQTSYVSRPVGRIHRYYLLHKDRYVTLTVYRSRASNVAFLPVFAQGDVIEGVVELHLEKERRIAGVKLSVCLVFSSGIALVLKVFGTYPFCVLFEV
jgi:hypothetical protein